MTQTTAPAPVVDHYAESASRFAHDTTNHVMTVLHDDGLYRHLRFRSPDSNFYWFDLVTWPGRLSFSGDMDGFTFARETDMFDFFRAHRSAGFSINPSCWGEKVDAGKEAVKVYSEDRFRAAVSDHLDDVAADYPPGLRAAVEADILNADYVDLSIEEEARQALNDFTYTPGGYRGPDVVKAIRHGHRSVATIAGAIGSLKANIGHTLTQLVEAGLITVNADGVDDGIDEYTLVDFGDEAPDAVDRSQEFRFHDTWEWNFDDYQWSFLWACHAIRWGIAQYDARKAATAATAGTVTP